MPAQTQFSFSFFASASRSITTSHAGCGLRYSSSVARRHRPRGFLSSRQKFQNQSPRRTTPGICSLESSTARNCARVSLNCGHASMTLRDCALRSRTHASALSPRTSSSHRLGSSVGAAAVVDGGAETAGTWAMSVVAAAASVAATVRNRNVFIIAEEVDPMAGGRLTDAPGKGPFLPVRCVPGYPCERASVARACPESPLGERGGRAGPYPSPWRDAGIIPGSAFRRTAGRPLFEEAHPTTP